jgi:hypothetical protein
MSSDKDTYFTTWTITDKVYISNNSDTLRSYDGTTFATVTGTAIPTPRAKVAAVLDRLFAITSNGIERTNSRSDSIWSVNSNWATFRPSQVGLFTALHSITLSGVDVFYTGAFAFQANAYYLITGTNFGSDVTSGTASTGEDGSIKMINSNVGTSSPDSVVTVPGVGKFWFTTDLNVFWVPEGQLHGQFIGDKLRSNGSTPGIESTNKAALAQVQMQYFDRFLILSIPVDSTTYPTVQFYLDLYEFTRADKTTKLTVAGYTTTPSSTAIWYGPMTGHTVGRLWREDQQGELSLRGGEGNPATGVFVYNMDEPYLFTNAVGTVDTDIEMIYQTYFKNFGAFSREKYLRSINLELRNFIGSPTIDVVDLDRTIIADVPIVVV